MQECFIKLLCTFVILRAGKARVKLMRLMILAAAMHQSMDKRGARDAKVIFALRDRVRGYQLTYSLGQGLI